jgi:hypothetical protein
MVSVSRSWCRGYRQRAGKPVQLPALQVLFSQQTCPMAPHASQVALLPFPEHVVPGCEQKRGTLVWPISQQGWPAVPHATAPFTQLPLALHMPAIPPHIVPGAMQV